MDGQSGMHHFGGVYEVELGCLRKSITRHFRLKAVLSIASRFQPRYATSIVFPFLALLKFGMF